jgi:predicted aldo/keto reductase-like oxidoreductase
MKRTINRRTLLRYGAIAGLASGLPSKNLLAASSTRSPVAAGGGVKKYAVLGRTGLQISDISFGSSRLYDGEEHLVHRALDLGINYFDTAESYTSGSSETVIGNALKGKRDKVVIATKTAVGTRARKEDIMASLEESLRRLRTDYVDVFFNHAVNDVSRLKNPEWFEFAEAALKQGKIRYTGMSGHAGRLIECLDYAIEQDMFDVILVAYNFGQDPEFYEKLTRRFDLVANQPDLPRVLERAKQKDVGVVAMKVLRGARLNDMRPFEQDGTYAQAALRWTLSNQNVDAAIISMTSAEAIEEYVMGSGGHQVSQQDLKLLEQYAWLTDASCCRHACNDCEGACPYGVPISDVLRTRMYATDYADLSFARSEYKQLGAAAAPCLSCDGRPCKDACTYELPIAKMCGPTHLMLG